MEKCIRFTAEDGYWVELPVMPLALSPLTRAIIDLLAEKGPLPLDDLHSILRNNYWHLSHGLTHGLTSEEALREIYPAPMWKQGLIAETSKGYVYVIGPQWELVRPYQKLWEEALKRSEIIEHLTQTETWLERETITWER